MADGNTTTGCFGYDNLDVTHTDLWQASRKLLTGYHRVAKYLDLREAASGGCQICSILLEGIDVSQSLFARTRPNTRIWFRCNPPTYPLEVGIQEHEKAAVIWLEFFTLAGKQIKGCRLVTEKDKQFFNLPRPARSMDCFWSRKLCSRKNRCRHRVPHN